MTSLPPEDPWAPPNAALMAVPPVEGVWRDGKDIVMRRQAELPWRCVCCNAPVHEPPRRQKLHWHPGHWYLLLILNAVLYLVVAIVVQRSAEIRPALCARHARRRRRALVLGTIALVLLASMMTLNPGVEWLIGGSLLSLIVILLTASQARRLRPTHIDDQQLRLRGADPRFLDSLPPLES